MTTPCSASCPRDIRQSHAVALSGVVRAIPPPSSPSPPPRGKRKFPYLCRRDDRDADDARANRSVHPRTTPPDEKRHQKPRTPPRRFARARRGAARRPTDGRCGVSRDDASAYDDEDPTRSADERLGYMTVTRGYMTCAERGRRTRAERGEPERGENHTGTSHGTHLAMDAASTGTTWPPPCSSSSLPGDVHAATRNACPHLEVTWRVTIVSTLKTT